MKSKEYLFVPLIMLSMMTLFLSFYFVKYGNSQIEMPSWVSEVIGKWK